MAKYKRYPPQTDADDWTEEIYPIPDGYRMACCDCGLVHNMKFKVYRVIKNKDGGRTELESTPLDSKKFRVAFQVSRNERATAAMRRSEKHPMAKKPIAIKKSHEGLLHKELKVPAGKSISEKRLHAAARSAKKSGNTAEEKRVIFAENFGHKKKGK